MGDVALDAARASWKGTKMIKIAAGVATMLIAVAALVLVAFGVTAQAAAVADSAVVWHAVQAISLHITREAAEAAEMALRGALRVLTNVVPDDEHWFG